MLSGLHTAKRTRRLEALPVSLQRRWSEVLARICPINLDFRKSIAFWKVPRFRSFILARATCRRWTYSIGGAILNSRTLGETAVSVQLVHNKSHMKGPEIELGPAGIKYENCPESYLNIHFVPRSKHISSVSQMKHQLDATLCRFYFCSVPLHVSGASAHHQEYLKLAQRPLVHVLSLQVSHHISKF